MSTVSPLVTDPRLSPNGHGAAIASPTSADITGTLMTITPAMASDLLQNRLPNRPISKSRIRTMIEDLRSGRWQTNGESIILDADLRLLDGQHRLLACMESGITIEAFVVVGVDASAMPSIDGGKPKVAGDFHSMHGMTQAKELAGAARWVFRFENGCMRASTISLRNDQLPQYVEARPALPASLPWGRLVRDLLPQSIASMLFFVMSAKDAALSKRFFDALAHGDALKRDHPAHVARERLLRDKSPRNHLGILNRGAIVVLSWNCLRLDRPMPGSLTWKGVTDATAKFPEIV